MVDKKLIAFGSAIFYCFFYRFELSVKKVSEIRKKAAIHERLL